MENDVWPKQCCAWSTFAVTFDCTEIWRPFTILQDIFGPPHRLVHLAPVSPCCQIEAAKKNRLSSAVIVTVYPLKFSNHGRAGINKLLAPFDVGTNKHQVP